MEIVKSVFSLLFGLVLFVGILYLAYISTKLIGKRYSLNGRKGRNLKLHETLPVGRDMNIAITQAGERFFLIGITEDRISLISELSRSDLDLSEEQSESSAVPKGSSISFADALKYNINKKLGRDVDINDYTTPAEPDKTEDAADD